MTKNNKKTHPIVKTNYLPRIIAASFYIIYTFSMLGMQVFQAEYVWLIILGLAWPHIARFQSKLFKESKNNEILNMHIDALFSACFIFILPTFEFMGVVAAILVTNGLFVGYFGLLFSTGLTALFILLFGHLTLFPISLIESNQLTRYVTAGFIIFYFGTFGAMGYKATRHMIHLNKKVKSLSITDGLTQCFNRLYLEKNLAKELQRSQRMDYPLSVLFADIDHFKAINDNYGHAIGDQLLSSFAKLVQNAIRTEVDWVARYGGEEFIIVLPNSSLKDSIQVANRIRKLISESKFAANGSEIVTTCSFGVASSELFSSLRDYSELVNMADNALYQAKEAGRNCVKAAEKV